MMGKQLNSHPKKLIITKAKVSSQVVRPEIKKMNGNRSTMNDITALLRNIIEFNSQIPKDLPAKTEDIDADLHSKLVILDLSFFEMIQGSSGDPGVIKMSSNTNKMTNSFASRLPKKTGRFRGNLMGKRVFKMGRSVITGDKALRLDQLGVPKIMLKNQFIPETVRSWNNKRLNAYFLNGTHTYPGCQKIVKASDGKEYYIDKLPKDYILQEGDIVYRNVKDGDPAGFNREPALIYCSIAFMKVKMVNGLTLRINPAVCCLFNADLTTKSRSEQVFA
jgi:DNA-directed RNA polymerase beta' subunit